MKVLFTCVGRRVELIQSFKIAAKKINCDLKILGTDADNTAPALSFCDKKFIVSPIYKGNYVNELLNICKKEKIIALIPTIDTDLEILALNKDKFLSINTKVIISNFSFVTQCRNKFLTDKLFKSIGLSSPLLTDNYLRYKDKFPAFIRPYNGSSSINAFKVNNIKELEFYAKKIDKYIVTKYINGVEYTVDILCDFKGKPIFITPRIRLAVRSGEVLKTEINYDKKIVSEIKRLLSKAKPIGPITVQLIKDNLHNINYYIEINPRFGGGAPLSIKAGADSAEAIIRMLMGETLKYKNKAAINGSIWSRFDQSIRIK